MTSVAQARIRAGTLDAPAAAAEPASPQADVTNSHAGPRTLPSHGRPIFGKRRPFLWWGAATNWPRSIVARRRGTPAMAACSLLDGELGTWQEPPRRGGPPQGGG
ncbi:MAG: hypothetical protein R2854_20035 [Caldilineaceae bacterium]